MIGLSDEPLDGLNMIVIGEAFLKLQEFWRADLQRIITKPIFLSLSNVVSLPWLL